MVRNAGQPTWTNLRENLGSDHYIIQTVINVSTNKIRNYRITDWDRFRELRKQDDTHYDTLAELLTRLKQDVDKSTKDVATDREVERMDSRLAHLLEAKNALHARWRAQKLNRNLRKKLADLNRQIEDNCRTL